MAVVAVRDFVSYSPSDGPAIKGRVMSESTTDAGVRVFTVKVAGGGELQVRADSPALAVLPEKRS